MIRKTAKKKQEEPLFINILTEEDKKKYKELRDEFSNHKYKNRRNRSHNIFKNMIRSIKTYINKDEKDKWKRSLVCGIILINDMIIINTHQLRILIDKCKSSINGSFQSIGYEALPSGEEYISHIISVYPFMKDNYSELRQWTARRKINPNNNSNVNANSPIYDAKSPNLDVKSPIFDAAPNLNEDNQNSIDISNLQSQQDCHSMSPISVSLFNKDENPCKNNICSENDEISPPPDLSNIQGLNEDQFLFFPVGNSMMDQHENFNFDYHAIENDIGNDFLSFIPKFPNNLCNQFDQINDFHDPFF